MRTPSPTAVYLSRYRRSIAAALWLLACGCTSSPDTLRLKLEAIGKEDLDGMVKELPAKARSALLAKPYYVVDEYQEFHGDTAIVFQARASLVFFYLDPSLDLCQVRKYRFKTTAKIWDRYEVKLRHTPPKYSGTSE